MDIPGVLKQLKGYNLSPIERVLAAHTGMVQLLLSLYFGEPVDVLLVAQTEENGNIRRETSLVLRDRRREACHAHSSIPLSINKPEVLDDIREGGLGLGQICVKHGIPEGRLIKVIMVTPQEITREYVIAAPGIVIREVFPRDLYE